MKEYEHIDTIFKRTPDGRLMVGEYATSILEALKDLAWIGTEKVDGTNIRVLWDGETVRCGGKTDNAQIPVFLLNRLQDIFTKECMAKNFEGSICLYGEGFGAKIQKGGSNYISNGVSFALFDAKVDTGWLQRDALEGIAVTFAIDVVPIIFQGTLLDACDYVRTPRQSKWGIAEIEGLVLQPSVQLFDRQGHRVLTKIKRKDFDRLAALGS